MQLLENPYLTVIVPAYNVEPYIRQCLDSLIFQTEKRHRILVVDDGSTDGTAGILQQYAREYPGLLEVLRQENRGLGAARNAALDRVNTPYVTFLDSDDWQNPRFVEHIRCLLEKQEEAPDIVFTLPWNYDAGCCCIRDWKDRALLEEIFFPDRGDSLTLNARQNPSLYALEPSTNRRVYRTAFLKQIGLRFTEGRKWEDVVPHFLAVHSAERCIADRDVGFFYRVNTGSQITSGGGASRLDVPVVFKEALALGAGWSPEDRAYMIRMMMDFCKWSVDVTDREHILPLLRELHRLFRSVPRRDFRTYLQTCPLSYRQDWLFIRLLRSPGFRILKDYRTRDRGLALFWKLKRILRRG